MIGVPPQEEEHVPAEENMAIPSGKAHNINKAGKMSLAKKLSEKNAAAGQSLYCLPLKSESLWFTELLFRLGLTAPCCVCLAGNHGSLTIKTC